MATKKYKCRQVKMDLKREQLGSRVCEDDECGRRNCEKPIGFRVHNLEQL